MFISKDWVNLLKPLQRIRGLEPGSKVSSDDSEVSKGEYHRVFDDKVSDPPMGQIVDLESFRL